MHTIRVSDRQNGTIIAEAVLGEQVIELENSWYFAPEQVDMTHLHITERTYTCPYKGVCHWIDLEVGGVYAQNVAWVYHKPKRGFEQIAGRIAFSKEAGFALSIDMPEVV